MIDLSKVEKLYTDNIKQNGIKPESVGWTKEGSQQLRFNKLMQVVENKNESFSLNELGCGYGELYKYCINNKFKLDKFIGYDISADMLEAAKDYINYSNVELINNSKLKTLADYSVTSGIFNVRFDENKDLWKEYIFSTLQNMNEYSKKGFSFNLLTSYVDYEAENLFYADPKIFFDYCKTNFSKKVNLIHDYDLYEWTIIVKK